MKNEDELEWFEKWFDSPYYHILYKNRNKNEAENFISNLINHIKPLKTERLLDIACGKGRHSIYLNKLGFTVDGFDLSENSIRSAKTFETNSLKFYVNDIRKPLKANHYDCAFNLFTSFGYFDSDADNLLAIKSFTESLKNNGILVLDFMNTNKVIRSIKRTETKIINDISFELTKNYTNGFITKDIQFLDKGTEYRFQEKVKGITLDDFKTYFSTSNLKIERIFGDYELNEFDEVNSDRLILLARKYE